ncbi:hypothetical protein LIER_29251 [Lithospermum erythrorhizon]|uniref:Uncharacterized protein n=1 Tax=Lithospermum erythrorhizon TaxID=34254 RepID=A0AAV3RM63_LITER
MRTPKDGFLYFMVRTCMKGFCKAIPSKVEPDTWRPFFYYALGEGLPPGIPSDFVAHLKSNSTLPRSVKHRVDANAFSTYWEDKSPMPLQFYLDRRVLKDVGLFPIDEANPGALEALMVFFCVHDHALPPSTAAPVTSPNKLPLRYIFCSAFNTFLPSWVCEILNVYRGLQPLPPSWLWWAVPLRKMKH